MANKRKHRLRGVPTAPFYKNRVRDDFSIASGLSHRLDPVAAAATPTIEALLDHNYIPSVRSYLLEVEDRRTYHPAGVARPSVSSRRHHTPKPSTGFTAFHSKPLMTFGAPRHVLICVRRKTRDEVLHALGKTGRGSGRPRKFNQYSKVRC